MFKTDFSCSKIFLKTRSFLLFSPHILTAFEHLFTERVNKFISIWMVRWCSSRTAHQFVIARQESCSSVVEPSRKWRCYRLQNQGNSFSSIFLVGDVVHLRHQVHLKQNQNNSAVIIFNVQLNRNLIKSIGLVGSVWLILNCSFLRFADSNIQLNWNSLQRILFLVT